MTTHQHYRKAHAYLQQCREAWKPLPDSELDGLSDEHKNEIREFEEVGLNGEFAAFSDIILNCTNKFQFAKTYIALREDYRRTFANPKQGNPDLPPEVNRLLRKTAMSTIEIKLRKMALWFYLQWDDQRTPLTEYEKAIERCANSGCSLGLLLFLLPWVSALGVGYLVLAVVLK